MLLFVFGFGKYQFISQASKNTGYIAGRPNGRSRKLPIQLSPKESMAC
jgi:hypothetical protein